MNFSTIRRLVNKSILKSDNLCYVNIRFRNNPSFLGPGERDYELGDFSQDIAKYLKRNSKLKKLKTKGNINPNEKPIIKCKHSELNHYRNQVYEKFDSLCLASRGWYNYKSKGDYFTVNIYTDDYIQQTRHESTTFEETGLDNKIIEILHTEGIKVPSQIQANAIPSILSGNNTLIAAETGCGKTLAYLAPIIHQILSYNTCIPADINSPFAIIVCPSRELSQQLYKISDLFENLFIRSRLIVGGHVKHRITNPLFEEVHILIATIGVLSKLVKAGIYSMKRVRHVILDEADTLLDDSFNDLLLQFLKNIPFRDELNTDDTESKTAQLILSSATMPTSIENILGEYVEVSKINKVCTDRLHHVMPHVKQRFWRISKIDKPVHLLRIVKPLYAKETAILIFCNKASICHWVTEFLNDNKIDAHCLSSQTGLDDRKQIFSKFQVGQIHVLVCTDMASRGLDTKRAEHVINYDFPLFMSDYIHRCGRTGRLGSEKNGIVTNLVSSKSEVDLVQKIETAVRLSKELPNVNANIKRILTHRNKAMVESTEPLEMFI